MKIEVGDTVMVPATVLHIDGGETYLELPEKPGRYQFRTETIAAWNARAGGKYDEAKVEELLEACREAVNEYTYDWGETSKVFAGPYVVRRIRDVLEDFPAPPTEARK